MIQETDAVVIGAGPVGLFQVFQLGLQGLSAHIIDALPYAGGQCVELYGDKPIYDIPGVPMCTGRELAALLQQQITPFQPQWHLNTQVAALQLQADAGRTTTVSMLRGLPGPALKKTVSKPLLKPCTARLALS